MDSKGLAKFAVKEARHLAAPLIDCVKDPPALFLLLGRLGWRTEGILGVAADDLKAAIAPALDAVKGISFDGALQDTVARIGSALQDAVSKLAEAAKTLLGEGVQDVETYAPKLANDLADFLFVDYLRRRWYAVYRFLRLVGFIKDERAGTLTLEGKTLRAPVLRTVSLLDQLQNFAGSPMTSLLGKGIDLDAMKRELALFESAMAQSLREDLSVSLTLHSITAAVKGFAILDDASAAFDIPTTPPLHVSIAGESITLDWSDWIAAATAAGQDAFGELEKELGGFSIQPIGSEVANAPAPRVTVERKNGALTCSISGGLKIELPRSVVAPLGDGARIGGHTSATLQLSLDGQASLTLDPVVIEAQDLHIGGEGGLLIKSASGTLEGLALPVPKGTPPWKLTLQGALQLPAVGDPGDGVQCKAVFSAGGFTVTATGDVHLGQGIRVHAAAADKPALSLQFQTAQAQFNFTLDGEVDFPNKDGVARLPMGGSLQASLSGGNLALQRIDVHGAARGDWDLPGGLTLKQLAADVVWTSQAGGQLTMNARGDVEVGGGTARATGTVKYLPGLTLHGTLGLQDVSVEDMLTVIDAPFTVDASSQPPLLGLSLDKAQIGLMPKNGANAQLSDFALGFDQVSAALTFKPSGFDATLGGTLLLPPEQFGGASGKPQAQLKNAHAQGTLKPFALQLVSAEADLGGLLLGGEGGLSVTNGTLELKDFSLPDLRASNWCASVVADLDFAGQSVHLEGAIQPDLLALSSIAHLDLGGLQLYPLRDDHGVELPVLSLQLHRNRDRSTGIQFAVSAEIDVPRDGGAGRVAVAGFITATVGDDGKVAIAEVDVAGESDSAWSLPGGLTLAKLGAEIRYQENAFSLFVHGFASFDGAQFVGAGTHAAAELQGFVVLEDGDAHLHGEIDGLDLLLMDQVRIFNANVVLDAHTRTPSGTLSLANCSAGLVRQGEGDTTDDFLFAATDVSASLAYDGILTLTVSSGKLLLPTQYFNADGEGRPQIDIGADEPLTLTTGGGTTTIKGELQAKNFSASVPAQPDLAHATLTNATLVFDVSLAQGERGGGDISAQVKFKDVAGAVHIELPDGQSLDLSLHKGAFDFQGFPTGQITLDTDIAINFGGDAPDCFQIILRGGVTYVEIERLASGYHEFTFAGGIRLKFPLSILQHDPDAVPEGQPTPEVFGEIDGKLILTDDPNGQPDVQFTNVTVGGTFRLGGGDKSLLINNGSISALNIDQLFRKQRDSSRHFGIKLDGSVTFADDGPTLGLKDALLSFEDLTLDALNKLPKFRIGGFDVGTGAMFQKLPIEVKDAGMDFKNPDKPLLPLPGLLDPENLIIHLSVGLHIPFGTDKGFMARVDRVRVEIDQGIPRATLGGVGFGITGVEVAGMSLAGAVYLGGLDTHPFEPFFAGKAGGTIDGMGAEVLVAFEPFKPLGVALDVSGGPAGIPVAQTGFLITGASGGVSFANRNGDPSDLSTYIDVPADGSKPPARNKTVEVKNHPDPAPPPDPSTSKNGKSLPTVRSKPSDKAELPGGRQGTKCPGPCPPPSVNIFCQPHPDQSLFPGKVILKFSSIDEEFLGDTLGLKKRLDGLKAPDASGLAMEIAQTVRRGVERMAPFDQLPDQIRQAARQKVDQLERWLTNQLVQNLKAAGSKTAWDVVKAVAYAGLPCPDETMQATGSLSYLGISAIASITGGFNVSTTGAVGCLGNLNIMGMKVGRARAFLTVTNEHGDPDPAICGEVRFVMGPLELGLLGFSERLMGSAADLVKAVIAAGLSLARPVCTAMLAEVLQKNVTDPVRELHNLTVQQASGFVGKVLTRGVQQLTPDALKSFVHTLLKGVWDSYNPEMIFCGMVQPKIFGIPLASELVSVKAWADKLRMGAQFSFSPTSLIFAAWPVTWLFVGGLLAVDQATFGAEVTLPDPFDLLDQEPDLFRPMDPKKDVDALERMAKNGVRQMINNAVYQSTYQLAPMGLRVADGVMRVILPDLMHHPIFHPWKPPEQRGQNLPSRAEVLAAALESGDFLDLHWRGTAGELNDLKFDGGRSTGGLSLTQDYFPHGGALGAGRLALPRIFVDGPPMDLIMKIQDASANVLERGMAAMHFVQDWLAATVKVGTMTFYVPAPNPPNPNDLPKDPQAILESICKFQLPPGQYLTNIGGSFDYLFLHGHLRGKLLGIDIGEADIEIVPPAQNQAGQQAPPPQQPQQQPSPAQQQVHVQQMQQMPPMQHFQKMEQPPPPPPPQQQAAPVMMMMMATPMVMTTMASSSTQVNPLEIDPGEGYLRIRANAKSAGDMTQLIEGGASLEFVIREKPPQPVEKTFNDLSYRLQMLARSPSVQPLLHELISAVETQLPKIGLHAKGKLRIPPPLDQWIKVNASGELYLFTPRFSKRKGTTPLEVAQHDGGAAFHAQLSVRVAGIAVDEVLDGSITPDPVNPASPPHMMGLFSSSASVDLGSGANASDLRGTFDSKPGPGGAWASLHASLNLPGLHFGPFQWNGIELPIKDITIDGSASVTLDVSCGPSGFLGSFRLKASYQGLGLDSGVVTLPSEPTGPDDLVKALCSVVAPLFADNLAKKIYDGLGDEAKKTVDNLVDQAKQGLQNAGSAAQQGAQNLEHGAQQGAQNLGNAMGDAMHKHGF